MDSQRLWVGGWLLSTVACGPSSRTGSATASEPPLPRAEDGRGASAAPSSLAVRPLSKVPDAVDAKGSDAWGWRDRNGENVVVVTYAEREESNGAEGPTTSRSMVLTHDAIAADGTVVRKRTVKDFVNDCPFDVHLGLEDGSLQTSDLDGDGVAELTFAYRLSCASDVSPMDRKVLLLEDGEKYILRGHTGVNLGSEVVPSEYEVDPSVNRAPPAFREHLVAAWGGTAPKYP